MYFTNYLISFDTYNIYSSHATKLLSIIFSKKLVVEVTGALVVEVVVTVSKPTSMKLNVHYLEFEYDISSKMSTKETIQQFLDDAENPSKIQCVLNLPFNHKGLSKDLMLLNYGIIHGWNQSTVNCQLKSMFIQITSLSMVQQALVQFWFW
ncbi:uncharacterized protein EDB93DRAFT_1100566 [Suillus bovinus]|uniref:uncharacterized protein n=1 Tax=Suillus bovinus TaxID=48563 RepID=UPI001B879746|nr:uncharacterized protein EDB93DRAFT_1100566 [Suillus bovinus]KAG2158372.1 hypothetical protein EDB93DRAFT_1100566 [Suillus bovinus]